MHNNDEWCYFYWYIFLAKFHFLLINILLLHVKNSQLSLRIITQEKKNKKTRIWTHHWINISSKSMANNIIFHKNEPYTCMSCLYTYIKMKHIPYLQIMLMFFQIMIFIQPAFLFFLFKINLDILNSMPTCSDEKNSIQYSCKHWMCHGIL